MHNIREHWLNKSDILESSLKKRNKESEVASCSNCQPKAGLSGELGISLNTNPFSIYNAKVKGSGDIRIDAKYESNSCIFCGRCITRIKRHQLETHSTEKEILKLKNETNDKMKGLKLRELRLTGNFRHNLQCLENGKGILIVMRLPKYESDIKYLPCPLCLGFLCKRELSKHIKVCPSKREDEHLSNPIAKAKELLMPHI